MSELVGLFLGWAIPFSVCLDDDTAGKSAKNVFLTEWGLSDQQVFTLVDVDEKLAGGKIESLLTDTDLALIGASYGLSTRPSKSQIQLFFSERLARQETVALSETFRGRIASFEKLIGLSLSGVRLSSSAGTDIESPG
jgi:hypothetical protein